MAAITGKNLYLAFKGTAIDTDYRSFNPTENMDVVDQSAGDDANRTYLDSLKDGTATAELVMQSDQSAEWTLCALGEEGTLEWGEEGTAAGNMRNYVNAIVTSRAKAVPFADLAVQTITWQYSGAVTTTVYPA